MQAEPEQLVDLARHYCDLFESLVGGNRETLAQLNGLLPRLHAAMTAIRPGHCEATDEAGGDLDQRFELFSRLHRLLGDLDAYWMEFDVTPNRQEMSGSLADDLTDIYCELKGGLQRLENPADARRTLVRWRTGFCKQWGQHVVDAERHLYALSARDRLY